MSARTAAATLMMTALLSGLPPVVAAQAPKSAQPAPAAAATPGQTLVERQSAMETRQRLRELLSELPPSLAQVLQLDPSLASNADYLTPYPALAAYLHQHPEVARNPSFFLGDPRFGGSELNQRR